MTKTSALVLACALTGAILAACGGAGSGGTAATTRPPVATAAPNAAGTEPPKQYDYGTPRTADPSSSPDYYGY